MMSDRSKCTCAFARFGDLISLVPAKWEGKAYIFVYAGDLTCHFYNHTSYSIQAVLRSALYTCQYLSNGTFSLSRSSCKWTTWARQSYEKPSNDDAFGGGEGNHTTGIHPSVRKKASTSWRKCIIDDLRTLIRGILRALANNLSTRDFSYDRAFSILYGCSHLSSTG